MVWGEDEDGKGMNILLRIHDNLSLALRFHSVVCP